MPLPIAEGVPAEPLRDHCRHLRLALQDLKASLPADIDRELKALLEDRSQDPAAVAEKIQKLLDPRCLIAVTINPESRVKAVRGPAAAELHHNRPTVVLVKIYNDAGITPALRVMGPQVRSAALADAGRWLEAVVHADRHVGTKLTGLKVQYVILLLTAREAGKREAVLHFDVGQGTQDLGFRAEVPVLFTVAR